jgi:acetylornithine/N-succinyldiaminopimelate aminotransferase
MSTGIVITIVVIAAVVFGAIVVLTTARSSEVRGAGLLLGIELENLKSSDVASALRKSGVLVNAANPTTIRLAPALIVTDVQIKKFISIFKKVMSDVK